MRNSKIKKLIISINLILISIISIINLNSKSLAVIVNQENDTGEITVSNVEQGVSVKLIQLARIEYDFQTGNLTDNYIWRQQIEEWIERNYPEYLDTREFYSQIKSNSQEAADFYQKITAAINKNEINASAISVEKTVDGELSYPINNAALTGNITFEKMDMGTYLVLIENGYLIYEPSIVNLIPIYDEAEKNWKISNREVIIKSWSPSITKNVTEDGKEADNYDTSEEIGYIIKADVPKYSENSISKKLYISDKMDKSLSLIENTVSVYGVTSEENEEKLENINIVYNTKRPNSDEDVAFLIEFEHDDVKKYKSIKITYNAKLNKNEELVIGTNGNNNIAYMDYSNNPYLGDSLKTQSSNKVPVYTYEIDLETVDRDNYEIKLDKSEFMILNQYQRYQRFIKGEDGIYYASGLNETEDFVTTISPNSEGKIYLKGLDEGEYQIRQVKTNDGYAISGKWQKVTIKDEDLDGQREDEYKVIIKNAKGYILPVTGGTGTTLLVSSGIILVISGILLIISINKKKKILKETK